MNITAVNLKTGSRVRRFNSSEFHTVERDHYGTTRIHNEIYGPDDLVCEIAEIISLEDLVGEIIKST